MKRFLVLVMACTLPLLLAACVPTREEADEKLGAACADAIAATFTDEKDHIEVQDTSYGFAKSSDSNRLREVTLKADYTYGDSEPDSKTYVCRYSEEWTLFSYLPAFYNLQRDDLKIGNFDGTIQGDTALLLKINDITGKHLH